MAHQKTSSLRSATLVINSELGNGNLSDVIEEHLGRELTDEEHGLADKIVIEAMKAVQALRSIRTP